ncbi:WOC protein, partial [Operophtera brumata]
MATEYEDQPADLESAMTANTITPSSHPGMPERRVLIPVPVPIYVPVPCAMWSLPFPVPIPIPIPIPTPVFIPTTRNSAKGILKEINKIHDKMPTDPFEAELLMMAEMVAGDKKKDQTEEGFSPVPGIDGNNAFGEDMLQMALKMATEYEDQPYTFGVNAWKQWVMTKNAEIEKSSIRRKPFKSEILQLTADELNYSLCLFVKEVRKPNGSEYAPDTIYYLVLECFACPCSVTQIALGIITGLWAGVTLGLRTVEEHMQLSFSHIMKHWKRNPNQPGQAKIPGSRNVLLRFYPPQSALEANSRKKKVYEQQENEENPLRCPVKLYEFYISK